MNRTFQKMPAIARIGIAAGGALLFSLLISLLASQLAARLPAPTRWLTRIGEGILCLSAFGSGFAGAKLAAEPKALGGLYAGGVFLVLPLCFGIVYGTSFAHSAAVFLLAVFFAALGAFFGGKEKKHRRRH